MKKRGRLVLSLSTGQVVVEAVRKDGLPDRRSAPVVSVYHTEMYQGRGLQWLRKESLRYYGGLVIRR